MIIGTLLHCFVLNTSVNSIFNKFITPVVPPNDKIYNSVLDLQNQANVHNYSILTKTKQPEADSKTKLNLSKQRFVWFKTYFEHYSVLWPDTCNQAAKATLQLFLHATA